MSQFNSSPMDGADPPEPAKSEPLTRWQRAAGSTIGAAATTAGVVSVFLTSNQAGSVALLLLGGVFLLIAVTGQSIHWARFRDLEIRMAQTQKLVEVAMRQPQAQGREQLTRDVLDALDPSADRDRDAAGVEVHHFEVEVTNAIEAARADGETVELHLDEADLGNPLLTVADDDIRIGVFAGYGGDSTGRMAQKSKEPFVANVPRAGYDGFVFINGSLNPEDLNYLVERIEESHRVPVEVESGEPTRVSQSLRPVLDRVQERARASKQQEGELSGP